MAAENENYLFAKMSTVLSYSIDGFTRADLVPGEAKFDHIEKEVSKHVRSIVNALKTSHKKFEDPDFGPTDKDPFGATSLYGTAPPAPAGTSKYPAPETLKWERPQYSDDQVDEEEEGEEEDDDDEFGDFGGGGDRGGGDEVWCMHGELFIDGSSSGDVIQGNLGDCWFLGALSVLGTDEGLLAKCFWRTNEFKEFGLFVCVFYKDCALRFVIIDDRIPVFSNSGKVVFAHCKDPNELWVLLIEKAYAKLHGCYKALIGGYVHLGLGDLTGFSPRLIGMRPGYMGYSDPIEEDQLWHMLRRYQKWKCLMGTSIQSKPGQGAKVEASAGQGLIMGHAYSFLAAGELDTKCVDDGGKVRLVKLRNPWGKGEWTGSWSDNSPEYEKYADALNDDEETFGEKTDGMNDGTFFMKFDDWRSAYTNIFVAMNFPKHWEGHIVKGSWDGESGGPREMTTWMSNSKIKFSLPSTSGEDRGNKRRPVFINLFISDTRLTLGKEYYKDPLYKVGVGFDVVREDEFNLKFKDRQDADGAVRMKYGWVFEEEGAKQPDVNVKQPPYMFGTTQLEAMVEVDKDYYIVPSVRNRKLAGAYYVQIYSDGKINLANSGKETALAVEKDVKEMTVGSKKVHLTQAQFFEKTEAVREKLIGEMTRLGKTLDDITRIFYSQKDSILKDFKDMSATGGSSGHKGIPRTDFKRRLMEMGFSLADFPDEDFIVLDENNDGGIDGEEFTAFLKEGLELNAPGKNPTPLEDPVDDLVFQPTDLEGELSVVVSNAKSLRKASSWFAPGHSSSILSSSTEVEKESRLSTISEDSGSDAAPNHPVGPAKRPKFTYDAKLAQSFKSKSISVLDRFPPTPKGLLPPSKTDRTADEKKKLSSNEGQKAGELLTDFDVDDPKLLEPQTPAPAKKGVESDRRGSRSSQGKGVKASELEDKAGLEAAKEIHVDSSLHAIEIARTRFLAKKKANLKLGQSTTQKEETGLLITRNFASSKKAQLAKMREIDADVREFLALDEYNARMDAKRRASVVADSKDLVPAQSTSDLKFLLGRNYSTGYRYDIWDVIIDRVAIMSVCRSEESKVLSKALAFDGSTFSNTVLDLSDNSIEDIVQSLQPCSETAVGSRLTTPISKNRASVKSVKSSRGTKSVSKNLRSEKGNASISSQLRSEKKQKSMLTQANEKLLTHKEDREKTHYTEVYRRVQAIPLMANKYLDEELCAKVIGNTSFTFGSTIQSWFEFFDKDGDGEISPKEFSNTMKELNTNMTDDAMDMLFMRFKSYGRRGLVDWKAFINFYEAGIMKKATDIETAKDKNHLLHDLMNVIEKLLEFNKHAKSSSSGEKEVKLNKEEAAISTVEGTDEQKQTVSSTREDSSGALEMTSLHASQIRQNIHVLKTLGLDISYLNMYRISRVFSFDLSKLKLFLVACENITVSPSKLVPVLETAEKVTVGIMEAMKQRCAVNKLGFDFTSHEELSKLWFAMAPSLDSDLDYTSLTRYFYDLFTGVGEDKQEESEAKNGDEKGTLELKMPWGDQSAKVRNFHVIVFCNLIAEEIMFSRWNRNVYDDSSDVVSSISYSAFKAFIQQSNVDLIEQKLQYLVHLQECSDGGLVNYLVHGYIPIGKKDHIIFILYDPLSSSMFKLRVDGDVSSFPVEKALDDVLKARYPHVKNIKKLSDLNISKNYNSVETPVEDRSFNELCSRFRLVNNGTHTTLTVAEDPKFVDKLKDLMEKANMPFFVIVNEISILFELSNKNAIEAGSMQKLVFGSIRKNKSLCNFLVNVMSDLRVVLRTYDGEKMENMEWVEMLAYLSGLRNPFVTVQLLPTYVEPEMGMIKHYPEELRVKYFQQLESRAKTGDNELQGKVSAILEACKEEDENAEEEVDEIFLPRVFTGPPDVDGGCHPSWDVPFKMKFKPPSLTSCPVKFTDICELYVEHDKKYMIVMVREAKDQSLFMTAYDPRSSTEYMLFGGPPQWSLPGISTDDVYFKVFPPEDEKPVSRDDAIQHQLDETIEMHTNIKINDPHKKLRLGFAITPRLVISVYNRSLTSNEELLGSCQISISSVLSGSGAHSRQWSTLMSEAYNKAGIPFFTESGLLSVDLGYTKKAELEALKQAKLEYAERCKEKMDMAKTTRRAEVLGGTADKSLTRVFSNSLQSVKVMSALGSGSLSNEDLVKLQTLNARLANEVKQTKKEADMLIAEKAKTLQKQETELKLLSDKLEKHQSQPSNNQNTVLKGDDNAQQELREAKKRNEELERKNEELKKQVYIKDDKVSTAEHSIVSGTQDSTAKLVTNIAKEMCNRVVGELTSQSAFLPLQGLATVYQDANACLGVGAMVSIFSALQMQDVDAEQCKRIVKAIREAEAGEESKAPAGHVSSVHFVQHIKAHSDLKSSNPPSTEAASSKQNMHISRSSSEKVSSTVARDVDVPVVKSMPPPKQPQHNQQHQPQQQQQQESKDDTSLSLQSAGVEGIDWDTYPLPEQGKWQRRVDKKTGRIFYQSHETRTTQWTHPLQPPQAKQAKRKSSRSSRHGQQHRSQDDSSTGAGGLHRTTPSQPSSSTPSATVNGTNMRPSRNNATTGH